MKSKILNHSQMRNRIILLIVASMLFVLSWKNRNISNPSTMTTDIWLDMAARVLLYLSLTVCAQFVDYGVYYYYSLIFYVMYLILIMLLGTPYGITVDGMTKCLSISGIDFHVTEMAKFILVLILTYIVHLFSERSNNRKAMLVCTFGAGAIMSVLLMIFSRDWQTIIITMTVTVGIMYLHNEEKKLKEVLFCVVLGSVGIGLIKILSSGTMEVAIQSGCYVAVMTGLYSYISLYAVKVGSKAKSTYGRTLAYAIALEFILHLVFEVVTINSAFFASCNGITATFSMLAIAIILSIERRNIGNKKRAVRLFNNYKSADKNKKNEGGSSMSLFERLLNLDSELIVLGTKLFVAKEEVKNAILYPDSRYAQSEQRDWDEEEMEDEIVADEDGSYYERLKEKAATIYAENSLKKENVHIENE